MAKEKKITQEEKSEHFRALIDTHPEIKLLGKSMLYTSVNGHMFTIMNKGQGLGIRLGKDDREKFIVDFDTQFHESHGALMKEYVRIPEELLVDMKNLSAYLVKSYE